MKIPALENDINCYVLGKTKLLLLLKTQGIKSKVISKKRRADLFQGMKHLIKNWQVNGFHQTFSPSHILYKYKLLIILIW